MRKTFRTIEDVLNSDITIKCKSPKKQGIDRILKSTRLEDKLYSEQRKGDANMDAVEAGCSVKLQTFPSLARDIYQSFYSLNIRHNDEDELSDTTKQFNRHILDDVMTGEDYPTIKSVCEGRQLPAYDAASEFIDRVSDGLDDLLASAGGDKGTLNTLDKLAAQEQQLKQELNDLLEDMGNHDADTGAIQKIIDVANKAVSKAQQVEAVGRQVRDNMIKNQDAIKGIISQASQSAMDRAEETALAMLAWGVGDDGTSPEQMKLNRDIINRIRKDTLLAEISKYLGRFKEMTAKARKNGYAYGRGEKYTLELGNDLKRVLTSEYTMLAVPATIPLFLKKHQAKSLKQYKRREAVFKGSGDMIMCLDESGSTISDAPWGKAVALALLDVAMAGSRKFALVHFSSESKCVTNVFLPGKYSIEDVFAAVATFLGGGTNFEKPLQESFRLIEHEGFEDADIVFVTDGECSLSDDYQQKTKQMKDEHKLRISGVLLDMESPGMDFCLKPFCDDIYRTSELSRDNIVETIIGKRV